MSPSALAVTETIYLYSRPNSLTHTCLSYTSRDSHSIICMKGGQRYCHYPFRTLLRKMCLQKIDNTLKHLNFNYLWPPYVIGGALYFCPVISIYLLSFFFLFFSSPNLSGHRLDLYHTSTHGVALVRI